MKLLTASGIVLILSGIITVLWTYGVNPPDFGSNVFAPIVLLMVVGLLISGAISFRLGRLPIRRSRVRVVAAIFLLIALMVPATFVYASETSVVGCLGPCGEYFPTITVSGTIAVQPGFDNGTLTVRLTNSGVNNTSLTSISFSNSGLNNDTTIQNIGSLVLKYLGNPVSPSNPLPKGETATGYMTVMNVTTGTTYDSYVNVVYQSGSHEGQQFFFPAQS